MQNANMLIVFAGRHVTSHIPVPFFFLDRGLCNDGWRNDVRCVFTTFPSRHYFYHNLVEHGFQDLAPDQLDALSDSSVTVAYSLFIILCKQLSVHTALFACIACFSIFPFFSFLSPVVCYFLTYLLYWLLVYICGTCFSSDELQTPGGVDWGDIGPCLGGSEMAEVLVCIHKLLWWRMHRSIK